MHVHNPKQMTLHTCCSAFSHTKLYLLLWLSVDFRISKQTKTTPYPKTHQALPLLGLPSANTNHKPFYISPIYWPLLQLNTSVHELPTVGVSTEFCITDIFHSSFLHIHFLSFHRSLIPFSHSLLFLPSHSLWSIAIAGGKSRASCPHLLETATEKQYSWILP